MAPSIDGSSHGLFQNGSRGEVHFAPQPNERSIWQFFCATVEQRLGWILSPCHGPALVH
jgi:hypothetical protein